MMIKKLWSNKKNNKQKFQKKKYINYKTNNKKMKK